MTKLDKLTQNIDTLTNTISKLHIEVTKEVSDIQDFLQLCDDKNRWVGKLKQKDSLSEFLEIISNWEESLRIARPVIDEIYDELSTLNNVEIRVIRNPHELVMSQ